MRHLIVIWVLALAAFLSAASTAWGIAGFSPVAQTGRSVTENNEWPARIIELINDPSRTVGWNFWFSECSNDANHYVFVAKSTDDLNRLLKKLAAVDAKGTTVMLSLGKEFPVGNFSFLKKGNDASAVLGFGNQTVINKWYAQLKDAEPGVKEFGVGRYTEPPKAMPPTLTIYVENPAVDLAKLTIPVGLPVSAAISKEDREKRKDDAAIKAIDRLLERRKAAAELR
jgi:hypothetical protein